jgi:ribosome-binding factor A
MAKRFDRSSRAGSENEATIRGLRLEQLFREELNSLLDGEVADKTLEATRIVRVELSRDGSRARIWFTHTEHAEASDEVQRAFQRAAGFLRRRLCEALPLKRMPELRFFQVPLALDEPGHGSMNRA